ncbi:rho GDP-dissociation inhibitor 1-like [Cornus florida]|uniref:rho GDP-dissociation inhibitor 1-like n=1 Tax=Cornus florida TaxID=4283 RepID=UPI0028973DF2|nr:rho GDP-dissociation inhibitor 1-like [Cornus florida]
MEGGKRAEAGSSSGVFSGSGVGDGKQVQGKQTEMSERPAEEEVGDDIETVDHGDDDDDGDDDHEEEGGAVGNFVPSPLLPLKDQLEKDKDDESLRRWKEKLLGCLEGDLNGQMEPEVSFHSIGIISEDLGEINTPLPLDVSTSSRVLFTLREGSQYRFKLTFTVLHNIVSGLTYTNTVWKGGLQVDQSKGMLGTFAPQREPYVHTLDEETTPSGVLARGIYSAKLKFEDDDRRCHMELKYSFEIRKSS